jgi:hypothetical protein
VPLTLRLVIALSGGVIYAAAGALIGSMNAGWLGLERNANAVLPALGVGAALVVIAFLSTTLHVRLREVGALGRVTEVLIAVGSLFFVLSWIIQFAIVGTLCLGLGLVCLSVSVTRWRLVATIDRVLIILSALGSLTWNTETVSAFLLVGVGVLWMILSIRLLPPSGKRESWNPPRNSKASRNI